MENYISSYYGYGALSAGSCLAFALRVRPDLGRTPLRVLMRRLRRGPCASYYLVADTGVAIIKGGHRVCVPVPGGGGDDVVESS